MAEYAVRPNCPKCQKPLVPSKFGGEGAFWCPNKKVCGFKGIKGKGFKRVISTDPIPVLKTASKEQETIFKHTTNSDNHIVIKALAGTGKTTVLVQMTRIFANRGLSVGIFAFARRDRVAIEGRVNDKADVNTSSGWGLRILSEYYRKVAKGKLNVEFDGFVNNHMYKLLKQDGLIDADGKWKCKRDVLTTTVTLCEKIRSTFPLSANNPNMKSMPNEADMMGIALSFGIETNAETWPTIVHYTNVMMKKLTSLEWMVKHGVDGTGMTFLPVYHNMLPSDTYDRVLVDEVQDQSYYTRMICEFYRKRKTGRIVAVGDENQAIYAWRGADSEAINEMIKLMSATGKVEQFPLTECRRCSKKVITLAQTIVPDIKALADAPEGNEDYLDENQMIADLSTHKKGLVVCRSNAPLISICLMMLAKEIPAVILRSNVVKDILTLVDNGSSGLGRNCPIEKLIAYVRTWEEEQISKLSERKGTEGRIQIVRDKAACIYELAMIEGVRTSGDLKSNLDKMFESAYDKNDKPNPEKMVVLSTVHGAKGGEAKTVYIYSPAPTEKKPGSLWDAIWTDASDRNNVLYVALTRCEHRIVFVNTPPRLVKMTDEPIPESEQDSLSIQAQNKLNDIKHKTELAKTAVEVLDNAIKVVPVQREEHKPIAAPKLSPPLPIAAYTKPIAATKPETKKKVALKIKPVVKPIKPLPATKGKIKLTLNIKKLPPLKKAK